MLITIWPQSATSLGVDGYKYNLPFGTVTGWSLRMDLSIQLVLTFVSCEPLLMRFLPLQTLLQ